MVCLTANAWIQQKIKDEMPRDQKQLLLTWSEYLESCLRANIRELWG